IAMLALGYWLMSLGAVAAGLAVAAFASAALLTDDRLELRWAAGAIGGVYAGVAAGAALHLHGVTAPEGYVPTTVVVWLDLVVEARANGRTPRRRARRARTAGRAATCRGARRSSSRRRWRGRRGTPRPTPSFLALADVVRRFAAESPAARTVSCSPTRRRRRT